MSERMIEMPKTKEAPATPTSMLRNAFAPEALHFGPRSMDIGAEWARAYSITNFPPAVDLGWLATAANLEGVVLSIHALPTDTLALTMAMSRAAGLLAAQAAQGGSALSQQRMQAQMEDAQTLLRKLDAEQQSVFTTGVVLLVTAPDEATGLRRSKRVEGALAAAGMRARALAYRQEDGLKAAGPWGLFPESLRGGAPFQLPAETLAASFPFSSGGINHGHGIVIGHDTSGGLVLFDRWNPPADAGISNQHMTILATSGAGKTWTTMLMLLREWMQGARVVIIDPEREYRHLYRALGGTWINAGGGGGQRINFLQAPSDPDLDDDDQGQAASAVAHHMQRAGLVLDLYLPQLTDMRRALLQRGLRAVYEAAGIHMDTDPSTIPAADWPHVGTLYQYCLKQEGEDWQALAALLEDAAIGATASLWAGPSAVEAGTDLVVLDIHDLESAPQNVQRAQYANVLGYAWDLIRADRSERKVLVVDEAWMLVDPKVPEALSFLKRMSKRARKYHCSVNVVTQNPGDFLAPEVSREGQPVLANASTRLLLRQEAEDLPTVAKLFGLSEAEQDRLRTARVGEGLLIAGNHRAWVVIDTAPHEAPLMYGGR